MDPDPPCPLHPATVAASTVGAADLAPAHRSGDVEALATPRLVALSEEATVAAVALHLPLGETTVGARVEFDHLAASRPGARVAATAVLEEVAGLPPPLRRRGETTGTAS